MLIKDLKKAIRESYQGDIKRQLRDALVALKIQGNTKVSTLAVLKDFADRGVKIGIAELLDLLDGDPLIQDANREEIIFSQDIPEPDTGHEEVTDEEKKNTVKRLARRAISKKFRTNKRW